MSRANYRDYARHAIQRRVIARLNKFRAFARRAEGCFNFAGTQQRRGKQLQDICLIKLLNHAESNS